MLRPPATRAVGSLTRGEEPVNPAGAAAAAAGAAAAGAAAAGAAAAGAAAAFKQQIVVPGQTPRCHFLLAQEAEFGAIQVPAQAPTSFKAKPT